MSSEAKHGDNDPRYDNENFSETDIAGNGGQVMFLIKA